MAVDVRHPFDDDEVGLSVGRRELPIARARRSNTRIGGHREAGSPHGGFGPPQGGADSRCERSAPPPPPQCSRSLDSSITSSRAASTKEALGFPSPSLTPTTPRSRSMVQSGP